MKKRFWFEEVRDKKEAHFVWTQLKEEIIFERQRTLSETEGETLNPETEATLTSTILDIG
jgi:hypothetical protein